MLITVHIPFYHFCTVCCTRDLVLLLDCRKGSISFFSSWWFHGARFSGCPKEDVWQQWALRQPPLPPPHGHSGVGGAGWAAGDHAERREFSGLLPSVLVSLTVSVRRAAGRSPGPFFTPSIGNGNHRDIPPSQGVSFLPFVVSKQESVYPQRVPLPQVPTAGHCTELSSSKTCWFQAPEPTAAF